MILVNSGSEGASNILVAAMQDHARAAILGTKTGKGRGIRRPFLLSDGSLLLLTTFRWFTPNSRSIFDKGIQPDFEFEGLSQEQLAASRGNVTTDLPLAKALEVL